MAGRPSSPDHLEVGVVTGAHGVRGGLRVHLHDGDPSVLEAGMTVHLVDGDGHVVERLEIDRVSAVPGKPMVRMFLDSITTREAAETRRGMVVEVERAALGDLEEDEFYLADVVGLEVVGRVGESPERNLGRVVGITSNGQQDLLEVSREGGGTWLIPVMPEFICEIADVLRVDMPAGMGPEDSR